MKSELGKITFTVLVIRDQRFRNYEARYRQRLQEVCQELTFADINLRRWHSVSIINCLVVRARKLMIGMQRYIMLNCSIRVKCLIELTVDQKELLLREISRRIFNIYPKLQRKNKDLMREYPDIINNSSGFPLSNSNSLRVALRTLTCKVAKYNCGKNDMFCANGNPNVIGAGKSFEIDSAHAGNHLVKSDVFRSSIQKMIPKEYSRLVMNGVCYNPCSKFHTGSNKEHWFLHIHTNNDCDSEEYFADDESRNKKQPISLQNACRLSVLETCFRMKRNGISSNVFFK